MSASKWRSYPEMMDSGFSWSGQIPNHWNLTPIKFFAKLSQEKSDVIPDGMPYIALEHIESKTGLFEIDNDVQEIGSSVSLFSRNDVLFGKLRPYLAKVIMPEFDGCCSSELIVLKSNQKIDSLFLKYLLLSSIFIDHINATTFGVKMPRASPDTFGSIKIPSPNFEEQKSIGQLLESENISINNTIANLKKMLQILEEKRSAVITQTVTKGLNPDVTMKDSGIKSIGMIPKHWEIVIAKHLEKNSGELVQTGPFGAQLHASDYIDDEVNGIPLILIKNVNNLKISSHDIPRISLEKAESLSLYRLKRDDIVFSRVGSVGRIAKVSQNEVGWLISGQMLRLRFTTKRINTDYAVYSISSKSILNYFELQSVGTTRDSINSTILSEMPMIVPPVEEQEQIVNYLNEKTASFEKTMGLISQQIVRITEYRNALISAAVTGKIDVRSL